ncbi:MAG: bifunctional hydroxymethylpyrimidine kinase/phosphomethylpyrimidine kinase [Acidimicrobiales bacterium]|nr:bifunctional hydroxymethylpyrimidine kinase/phosphomethylpyrimidine kinase [Acidimicrobiales bacterium]
MVTRPWPVVLTIAGSDSSGGAGIQADLRTFAAFGVWATVAVTAVTAQNEGVRAAEVMSPDLVAAQIDSVVAADRVAAVKTGMLGRAGVVEAVGRAIRRHDLRPVVVDPVLSASGGGVLLEPDGVSVMKQALLEGCALFTPNIPEAEAFLGSRILSRADMPEAARALAGMGPEAALLKGGHLSGSEAPDCLWESGRITWFEGHRLDVARAHGTGCALSAAITAQLALGMPLVEACRGAKEYVSTAIQALQRPGAEGLPT